MFSARFALFNCGDDYFFFQECESEGVHVSSQLGWNVKFCPAKMSQPVFLITVAFVFVSHQRRQFATTSNYNKLINCLAKLLPSVTTRALRFFFCDALYEFYIKKKNSTFHKLMVSRNLIQIFSLIRSNIIIITV